MIIFIDIDGTICNTINGNYADSTPKLDNIAEYNKYYDEGNTVIYWTARGSVTGRDWQRLTKEQLNLWGVKYTELRFGKPAYDIWVDDKSENPKEK